MPRSRRERTETTGLSRPTGLASRALCAVVGIGVPFHIDFVGNTTFDQVGPMLAALGLLVAVGIAMFRSRPVERPTVTPDVASAMWEELAEAPTTDAPATGEREPVGARTD